MSHANARVSDEDGYQRDTFECARGFLGIARELSHASSVCMGLEGNVAHLISHYSGEDRSLLIRELQQLDTLNQLIVALSSYASVLGSQCITGAPLNVADASEEMGLSRLAARLRDVGFRGAVAHGEPAVEAGEMDMF